MANLTASATRSSDQVIKSEMPLRIALLVLPAPIALSQNIEQASEFYDREMKRYESN